MRARGFEIALFALSACAGDGDADGTHDGTGAAGSGGTTAPASTSSSSSSSSDTRDASSGAGDSDESGGSTGGLDESSTSEPLPTHVMLYATSDSTIHGWRIDLLDGTLLEHSELVLGDGELGPLTHDHAASRLYVGRWDDGSISTLAIDATSGALDELGELQVDGAAVYLTVDHGDGHLLFADYNNDRVASYALADDGTLVDPPTAVVGQGDMPHSIVLAPAGDFAFVPNLGTDQIRQLVYDASTGALTPNEPAQVDAPAGAGPRHMTFAEDARHAWVINEAGDSITAWSYDASTGLLSMPSTVSTLPRGVDGGGNTCADLHLAPGGAFLYGSNRGHDTLAIYGVDARGQLAWLGEVATEAEPRSFAIEPTGRFLLAGGRGSGRLASYAIADDGMLQPLEIVDAPPAVTWVEPVALPR